MNARIVRSLQFTFADSLATTLIDSSGGGLMGFPPARLHSLTCSVGFAHPHPHAIASPSVVRKTLSRQGSHLERTLERSTCKPARLVCRTFAAGTIRQ